MIGLFTDSFCLLLLKKVVYINWLKTKSGSSIRSKLEIHLRKSYKLMTYTCLFVLPSLRQHLQLSAEVINCSCSCFSSLLPANCLFLTSSSRHASRSPPPDGAAWNHAHQSPVFSSAMQCSPNCEHGIIRHRVRPTTSTPHTIRRTAERYYS